MGLFDDLFDFIKLPAETTTSRFNVSSSSSLFDPFGVEEKRNETQELIQKAKEYISEGKSMYENALEEYERTSRKAQSAMNDYVSCCKRTANLLESDITPVMRRFDAFQIDSRVSDPIQIKELGGSISFPQMTTVSAFSRIQTSPSLIDWLVTDLKYDKAKNQLDEARKYKSEMQVATQELLDTKDRLNEVRLRIVDEKGEIEALTQKANNISVQLKNAMERSSFTSDDARYYKGLRVMVEELLKMISTEFLNDNMSLTEKFKTQSSRIHEINRMIPSAPNINDYRLQETLKRIAEDMIRY